MRLSEFGYVVLGNEPAGLWLLRRLVELSPESEKFLWVRFDDDARSIPVPSRLARPFELKLGAPWSAEIVSPSAAFRWRDDELKARFPELPADGGGHSSPTGGTQPRLSHHDLHAVRYAIRHHPELLTFSQGIWKRLGRTHNLHAEAVVSGALSCTELGWWRPEDEVPERVETLRIHPRENVVESLRVLREGALDIGFHGHEPIVGKRWILNAPWHRILALSRKHRGLIESLNVSEDLRSREALAPLRVRIGPKALPAVVPPLVIRFDTDEIPDVAREVWPIELQPGAGPGAAPDLAVWATVPRELSLDAALEAFRGGVRRLYGLFPFLEESIESFSLPLEMETCFSDEQRGSALDALERDVVELHDYTSLQTQTRLAGLKALLPSHHCNLPHPVGPLHAARALLEELVGKKRLQAAAVQPAKDAGSHPPVP